MTDSTSESISTSASDWDIFKTNQTKPKFLSSSYEDSVKDRLKESISEYTGDDELIDKLSEHLCDILQEDYKYYNDRAVKIKSLLYKVYCKSGVF